MCRPDFPATLSAGAHRDLIGSGILEEIVPESAHAAIPARLCSDSLCRRVCYPGFGESTERSLAVARAPRGDIRSDRF